MRHLLLLSFFCAALALYGKYELPTSEFPEYGLPYAQDTLDYPTYIERAISVNVMYFRVAPDKWATDNLLPLVVDGSTNFLKWYPTGGPQVAVLWNLNAARAARAHAIDGFGCQTEAIPQRNALACNESTNATLWPAVNWGVLPTLDSLQYTTSNLVSPIYTKMQYTPNLPVYLPLYLVDSLLCVPTVGQIHPNGSITNCLGTVADPTSFPGSIGLSTTVMDPKWYQVGCGYGSNGTDHTLSCLGIGLPNLPEQGLNQVPVNQKGYGNLNQSSPLFPIILAGAHVIKPRDISNPLETHDWVRFSSVSQNPQPQISRRLYFNSTTPIDMTKDDYYGYAVRSSDYDINDPIFDQCPWYYFEYFDLLTSSSTRYPLRGYFRTWGLGNGTCTDDWCECVDGPCCDGCHYKTAGTECYAASSDCDVSLYCDGLTETCNGNMYKSSTTQCAGDISLPCSNVLYCTGADITCPTIGLYKDNSTKCYNQTDACDKDVYCDGTQPTCPTTAANMYKQPSEGNCYTSTTSCAFSVTCSGTSAACPDHISTSDTLCYTAADLCEQNLTCSGTSEYCANEVTPSAIYKDSTSICYASQGDCDRTLYCTGTQSACVGNKYKDAMDPPCAGGLTQPCSSEVYCNGLNVSCPSNWDTSLQYKSTSTICYNASSNCDQNVFCDGLQGYCPDHFDSSLRYIQPSAGNCYTSTSKCAVDMTCTGSSADCPSGLLSSGFTCFIKNDSCSKDLFCDGVSAFCPDEVDSSAIFESTSTVCWSTSGPCAQDTYCSGSASACPATVYNTDLCLPAAGPCQFDTYCSGTSDLCPSPTFKTSVCYNATDVCEVNVYCDGIQKDCPTTLNPTASYVTDGRTCYTSVGLCDQSRTCTGSSPSCPTDIYQPANTQCYTSTAICETNLFCDGSSVYCAHELDTEAIYQPSDFPCYTSPGPCAGNNTCTGNNSDCPPINYFTSMCRTAAGVCDMAAYCTGSSTDCPANQFKTTQCFTADPANPCQINVSCDGTNYDCPTSFDPTADIAMDGRTCYSASYDCDQNVVCDGTSILCTGNKYMPTTTVCYTSVGECDQSVSCSGSDVLCPSDTNPSLMYLNGNECKAKDNCSSASYCPGNSTSCPTQIDYCSPCAHTTEWDCVADLACRWCGDAGMCQNVRWYDDCVLHLPCNESVMYMVAGNSRGTSLPGSCSTDATDQVTSFEIVTDYTGYVLIHYICGLISTALKNPDGVSQVPISMEAVFYDSDNSTIDPATGMPIPDMTPVGFVPIDLNATWGVYVKVGKIVDDQRWLIDHKTMYVGFRWVTACPGIKFEELTEPTVPSNPPPYKRSTDRTVTFSRTTSADPWAPSSSTGIAPFSLYITSIAICGDNITMDTEECDGGIMCENCTCPFNYIQDNSILTAWDPIGCMCPTANPVHPHWFTDPPTMNVTRVGGDLILSILLPQAQPSRWNAVAALANTNGTTHPAFTSPMEHRECYFWFNHSVSIQDLLNNFDFYTVQHDSFYELNFGVAVSWMERVPLGPDSYTGWVQPVDRDMTAKLSIGLLINRVLEVNSTIWVLDDRLIWAYVSKSYLYIINGDMFVDLEILTRTLSENITIQADAFRAVAVDPMSQAILWSSNLTLVYTDPSDARLQRWSFRVHLNFSVCTTEWYDNITLTYNLTNTTTENLNKHEHNMFITISKMEDWCGVQQDFDQLNGVQKTYLDENLQRPATRFWANDTVIVGVEVLTKYNMVIENVSLVTSRLMGSGLTAGDILLYNRTAGYVNAEWMTEDIVGLTPECTGAMGCYKFFLPESQVIFNKPITIYSEVFFTAQGMKRSAIVQQSTTFSRFSAVTKSEPIPFSDPQWNSAVIVKPEGLTAHLSAPFLMAVGIVVVVPVVCLAVIFWITRSRLRA